MVSRAAIVPVSSKRVNTKGSTRPFTVMLRTILRILYRRSDGAEHMFRRRTPLGGGALVATMTRPYVLLVLLTASKNRICLQI